MKRLSETVQPLGKSSERIFITMPAYRAEKTLGQTVADIPEGWAEELILVDDASPDRTVERARDLGIRVFVHSKNRGYGGNQKSCYSIALEQGADIVVLLHPDYQYDPKAVPLLVAPILAGDADMTFGSRFAGLGDPRSGGMPIYRYVGNRFTTFLENAMLKARFTEMHSGMRAYTRDCLLGLPFRGYSDDYLFDSQLLIDAVTSGQRVVEVPIPTRYTEESSSISVLRSLGYVTESLLYCGRQTWSRGRRGSRWPRTISGLRRGRRLGRGMPTPITCQLCDANICFAISSSLIQCLNCGLVSSKAEGDSVTRINRVPLSTFSACLARLRKFWFPGPGMAILAHDPERLVRAAGDRGWNARSAAGPGELSESRPDSIFLENLIPDIDDPISFLRSLGEQLSQDGVLAVTISDLVGRRTELEHLIPPARRHYFSTVTLHATLRRAGLSVVDWTQAKSGRDLQDQATRRTLVVCRKIDRTKS